MSKDNDFDFWCSKCRKKMKNEKKYPQHLCAECWKKERELFEEDPFRYIMERLSSSTWSFFEYSKLPTEKKQQSNIK